MFLQFSYHNPLTWCLQFHLLHHPPMFLQLSYRNPLTWCLQFHLLQHPPISYNYLIRLDISYIRLYNVFMEQGIEQRKAFLWKIFSERETEQDSIMKYRDWMVKINNMRLRNYNDTNQYFVKLFWGYTVVLRKKFIGELQLKLMFGIGSRD